MSTNRIAGLADPKTKARRLLDVAVLVDLMDRKGHTARGLYWMANRRWGGTGSLAVLSFDEFRRVLAQACHAGLLMKDETRPDEPPRYILNRPGKAIGSKLDAEVAAFRAAQPSPLPGQLDLFAAPNLAPAALTPGTPAPAGGRGR